MAMIQWLAIAGGGAAGALSRFGVTHLVQSVLGRGFPYGTMTANIAGSLLMGLLYILFLERFAGNEELRLALTTGFLGAFTTFSTFSVETLLLFEGGELLKAVSNVLVTVIVCLFAAWLGMKLGRLL